MSLGEAKYSTLSMSRGVIQSPAAATAGSGSRSTVLASRARRLVSSPVAYRMASDGHWLSLRVKISRVVSSGWSRSGLAIPVLVRAASTAGRPTRLISMSVAVLSLTDIMAAAASSTETRVPSGSSCSVAGRQALELRRDGQRLVPAHRARGRGLAQRVQHVELERRADRRGRARVDAVHRLARAVRHVGHQQPDLRGHRTQRGVDVGPAGRRRPGARRADPQPADQALAVDGQPDLRLRSGPGVGRDDADDRVQRADLDRTPGGLRPPSPAPGSARRCSPGRGRRRRSARSPARRPPAAGPWPPSSQLSCPPAAVCGGATAFAGPVAVPSAWPSMWTAGLAVAVTDRAGPGDVHPPATTATAAAARTSQAERPRLLAVPLSLASRSGQDAPPGPGGASAGCSTPSAISPLIWLSVRPSRPRAIWSVCSP